MVDEKLVPKLRFSGFNSEWEAYKLGDIASFKNGINKSKEDFGTGYPLVNLENIFDKDFLSEGKYGLVEVSKKELNEYDLKKGDVLFVRSSVKPSGVGLTTVIGEDLKNTVYSGFIIRFREINPILDINFKRYCFNIESFRNSLMSKSTTSANTNINQQSLSKLIINVPTIREQEKIANFLLKIDKKIELLENKCQKYLDFKKYLMQQIFTQKLRFADSNDEWEDYKFKDLGTVKSGVGFSTKYQGHLNLEYNVYKVSDMNLTGNEKVMIKSNNTINDSILNEMGVKLIKEPSIIFAKVGEAIFLNRKRIAIQPFIIDNNMMAFTPNKNVDLEFMYYLANTINFGKYAQTGALPSYNASDIYSIKCKLPLIKEQKRIAKLLSLVDNKINYCSIQINNVLDFKKGLLQQMFI